MPDISKQLSEYLPAEATPIISRWIVDTGCRFKVSKSRVTKLGDYRAPHKGKTHQITVNHELNEFAFLITTVHEFAHLMTWQEYRGKVRPHGTEWKTNFKFLMAPFFKLGVFPEDILMALIRYMDNPAASSCTDINLHRTLRQYDPETIQSETVETIADHSFFKIRNGRTFQKMEKLRKRYKCKEFPSGKLYLFNPIAEVIPLNTSELTKNQQHILTNY
ncbi:MAG: SprT-like domain-containing protein [Sphingobacterium sp.]